MTTTTYSNKVFLIDATNTLYVIEARVYNGDSLSICGECAGGCGQILDCIQPATDAQIELLRLWREYHLKTVGEGIVNHLAHILLRIESEGTQGEVDNANDDDEAAVTISQYFWDSHKVVVPVSLVKRNYERNEYCHTAQMLGWNFWLGTWEELEEEARKYLEEEEWVWREAVHAGSTQLGFKDWVDEVINDDGFAAALNSWDGSYTQVKDLCCCER